MTTHDDFAELDHFFGAYLNQDFDLSGESIEDLVRSYLKETAPARHSKMLAEIAAFRSAHAADLDRGLSESYGNDFDPEPWGHTAASFFQLVESEIRNSRNE